MRRIPLLCLVAALLIAPAAKAASVNQIVRDCADDGVLEGHYTAAELRKAERHLPTDVAEYSNCGDLLSRAADAAAATPRSGTSGTSGGGSGGGGSGSGSSGGAVATATPADTPDTVAAAPVGPSTPQDAQALAAAANTQTPPAIHVRGRRVLSGLAANISRNSLPSTLVVALILLAAAAVAVAAPALRRVIARRRT
jgi:hypothetical protein